MLAFYFKLFAVFILVPLALFYLWKQEKIEAFTFILSLFSVPLIVATLIWYTVDFFMMPSYLPQGLGYMFLHSGL